MRVSIIYVEGFRGAFLAFFLTVACATPTIRQGFVTADQDADSSAASDASPRQSPTSDLPADDGSVLIQDPDGSQAGGHGCPYADGVDHDGDGFSFVAGDCNDCDPSSNPGAFDVPDNGVDEDCNGTADDEPTGCDRSIALDSADPYDAARTIDLCRTTTADAAGRDRTWGVVDAAFVAPDGTDQCFDALGTFGGGASSCAANPAFPLGHGNLAQLGVVTPRVGGRMLGISSGTARDPSDPAYVGVSGFDKGFTVNAAPGFPAPAPACPGVLAGEPHDGMALALTLRVPTNARSFSLSEDFFSYEFPDFICSRYNDTFVVELGPPPPGSNGGNVAFDQGGNPICVNSSLLEVCDPQVAGGKAFTCPLGASTLVGTGFGADTPGGDDGGTEDHAATGWLTTTVNVDPSLRGKNITLLFAIWDSGDGLLDSTALLDGFTWSTQAGASPPVTVPSPPR